MKPLLLSGLTALLFFTGCVSTPQSRVDKNQDLFASFTAAQKETILKGEVDLDFTPEMVMMAAGIPDRKATKKSKDGQSEVWTYYRYTAHPISGYGYGYGGYSPYFSFHPRYGYWVRNSYWGDSIMVANQGEREKNLVVEFQQDKVVSFEMVN